MDGQNKGEDFSSIKGNHGIPESKGIADQETRTIPDTNGDSMTG